MSILPAKPKLTPEELRARQADQLAPMRLRMAINYELDRRGITKPKVLGAMLGMPRDEAVSLLTRQYLREGDVALLEAIAAQLGGKGAGLMTAGKIVMVLSFVLVAAVANSPSLSDRARWPLLLLALVAGILAVLRRQGVL